MMKIILIGSGGCMRELVWQMQEFNRKKRKWEIVGYIDANRPENGNSIIVGKEEIYYLGDDSFFESIREPVNVVIAIGNSCVRKRVAEKLIKNPLIQFPTIVMDNARICKDARIGQGCIISMDCRISTNVTAGKFVFMNTGSMICHDGIIGDYVTLSPDVKLAGAVVVGDDTQIGIGAKIIQGISIGCNAIIGAGSIVVRDAEGGCTYAGVPAKKIRG